MQKVAFDKVNPNYTTELQKNRGVYTFDMWIKKQADNYQPPGAGTTANYVAVEPSHYQNIGEISRDFTWLDDEVM